MMNIQYIMVTRFSNVGKHDQQSEGIGLLIPGIGSMGRRYMRTIKDVGCVSLAGRIKSSHIILRIRTEVSSSTSRRLMRFLKTTVLVESGSRLLPQTTLQPLRQSPDIPQASLTGKFSSYG
jgi:hypothetical protein